MKFSDLKIGNRITIDDSGMIDDSYRFAKVLSKPSQIYDGTWEILVEWDGGIQNYIRSGSSDTYYLVERIEQ